MTAVLIIPAAGRGTRFGADRPKQFLDLAGEPVLLRTLRAFAGLVERAVLASDPLFRPDIEAIAAQAPFPVHVVAGGATRQDSVWAAIQTDRAHPAAGADDALLIHDAVRPLVPAACIRACLDALAEHPAALVAVPCAATVKRAVTATRRIASTVPRDDLWLAQTPQGLRRSVAERAFADAAAAAFVGTDDVQLAERLGIPVQLVPGDAVNFKITTPDDLRLAQAVWQAVHQFEP
jgi:2-C-methyl-D-erythritol 4-phosphate cytidylyltransferase/2-C-methyl-D-erythritol 2,4-cyclodiphosphate synthase